MTSIETTIRTGKKVLIVDDDHLFCALIAETLNGNGYEALQAFTGEDSLTIYEQEKPDLILLDVAMPGISGFEVATIIRNREQDGDHHTPIVIMTAHASSYTVSVSFNMGISSYLTKPVLPHDVLAQVRTLLPLEANAR